MRKLEETSFRIEASKLWLRQSGRSKYFPRQTAHSPNISETQKATPNTGLSTALPSPSKPPLSHGLTRIPCFPIYHIFQPGATHNTVLCHVDQIISNALRCCLLSPPDSETTPMALCAPFPSPGSEAMPYFCAEITFLSPS